MILTHVFAPEYHPKTFKTHTYGFTVYLIFDFDLVTLEKEIPAPFYIFTEVLIFQVTACAYTKIFHFLLSRKKNTSLVGQKCQICT